MVEITVKARWIFLKASELIKVYGEGCKLDIYWNKNKGFERGHEEFKVIKKQLNWRTPSYYCMERWGRRAEICPADVSSAYIIDSEGYEHPINLEFELITKSFENLEERWKIKDLDEHLIILPQNYKRVKVYINDPSGKDILEDYLVKDGVFLNLEGQRLEQIKVQYKMISTIYCFEQGESEV